ncbi:MAG: endopeptidase La [Phycisphaerae bacterium]|nr:endopeptidase La [Phycisphaerae bacterium]
MAETKTTPEQETTETKVEAPPPADRQVIIAPGQLGPQEIAVPASLPLLAVRDTVIFPGTVMSLQVGRERSKRVIDEAVPADKMVGIISQRDPNIEMPGPEDLRDVGTICMILKVFRLPDSNQSILLHGLARFRIKQILTTEPIIRATVELMPDVAPEAGKETEALVHTVRQTARQIIEKSPNVPDEAMVALENVDTPGQLADFLAANLVTEFDKRQQLLGMQDVMARLKVVESQMADQLDVLNLSAKIQNEVKERIEKGQREYFLQEQLKAIQRELGQEEGAELAQLRQKLADAKLPEKVKAEADREINRLAAIPQASPEYTVIRTYLEWLADLPWSVSTEDKLDIRQAEAILNEDHYDLKKVKQRILEFLAVRKLHPEGRGPILCFIGPPGVGKTSLGQSIARALGRKFVRISLGGIRDEADIRGHRRTYIGALPGRILQEIRKAGANNPLFMLDEIDKVGADFRGDPASALLEVLDPAQNDTFTDHYLDVPFDLSKVMFIATGNVPDPIHPALRDRMEMIHLPGYTSNEKMNIARKYLVPRQLRENGVSKTQCKIDDSAIQRIIDDYTRESGVRNLERSIASVCRATAARIVRGDFKSLTVTPKRVEEFLGPVKIHHDVVDRVNIPGVAVGLAYTPVGGEIIFVEATGMPGRGRMTLTGQIGDVMRESATAAFSLIRSRADALGIDPRKLAELDIHVHVPAGAVPKDGPSAGVAMLSALASLILGKPIKPRMAMTGEITLRGLILPVGGIKEKVLAAKQAGVRDIILPALNKGDLAEIRADDQEIIKGVTFHPVERFEQVLALALGVRLKPGHKPLSVIADAPAKSSGSHKGKSHRNAADDEEAG